MTAFRRRSCIWKNCIAKRHKLGFCYLHYTRDSQGLDMNAPVTAFAVQCAIEGCPFPHRARGLCAKHYDRWKKGQMPDYVAVLSRDSAQKIEEARIANVKKTLARRAAKHCGSAGCSRIVCARGLCGKHLDESLAVELAATRAREASNALEAVWAKRWVWDLVEGL